MYHAHVHGLGSFSDFLTVVLWTVLFNNGNNGSMPKKSSNIVIALLSVLHHSFHYLQDVRCGRGLVLMVKHQQAHPFSCIQSLQLPIYCFFQMRKKSI